MRPWLELLHRQWHPTSLLRLQGIPGSLDGAQLLLDQLSFQLDLLVEDDLIDENALLGEWDEPSFEIVSAHSIPPQNK